MWLFDPDLGALGFGVLGGLGVFKTLGSAVYRACSVGVSLMYSTQHPVLVVKAPILGMCFRVDRSSCWGLGTTVVGSFGPSFDDFFHAAQAAKP